MAAGYPCGIKRLESETSFDAFAIFCQPPPATSFFQQHVQFARQARFILTLRRKESDFVNVAEGFCNAAGSGAVSSEECVEGFRC